MSDGDETASVPTGWALAVAGFRPGDPIGGRYRVLRRLGRGAMGEVYAVFDEQLGSEVALKLLKLEAHADPDARERFKREILLARRVSHPNVCRIYDFGSHQLAGGAGALVGPLHFLTMELLAGETLVQHLERRGPLAEAEALDIARQLAAALDAAHAAGVVHRDFKSANVMLVEGPPARAVVTDFGLARDIVSRSDHASLTVTGGVVGTPAYMSPEQVEGVVADARSDLYALGVVLYEMLTGHFPFAGDSPLTMALQRLKEAPTPPERFRPELSSAARATLRRALARRPEARYPTAGELVADLETSRAPRWRRRGVGLAAAVAVALATVGGAAWWLAGRSAQKSAGLTSAVARGVRPAIAVLPLRNANGRPESAWLATALAEMLTTELAGGELMRAVPGETVGRVVRDLGLAAGETMAAETLARLRRALGADVVLTGSYVALGEGPGGPLRLDLRLQFLDGRPALPRLAEGTEADLFALVGRAGGELRRALGLPETAAPAGDGESRPRSERALRLYALGLDSLRAGDPQSARQQFEASLVEDPQSPLVWSALSEAWSLLGWSDRAREAAKRAFESRATLPRAEALAVEGRWRLASGEWEAAIEIQRALWRVYPDDPEQGLRLVHALLEADRGREAEPVLAELRALAAPAGDDPRIDLYAARVADGLSEPRRQLEAAARAEAKAAAAGSRSLLARAAYEQGLARRKLGEPEAARAALERSRDLATELGDRNASASAMLSLAHLVRAQGRLDEAAMLYGDARATFAALGNRRSEARAEFSQGLVVSQQGDRDGALVLYGSALAKLREVDDRRGSAAALANIGTLLYEKGDLAGSQRHHAEAVTEFRAIGDESRVAVALQNLAQIRLERGDLEGAARDLEEELAIARRSEDKTVEGYALKALGDLERERGRFDRAEARYREAIERFSAAGQSVWQLYAEMASAVLERERGQAEAAAAALERIAGELGSGGLAEDRDEAELERARSLIAAGRLDEAAGVADEVAPRAAASETARLRHLACWTRAELALARGDGAAAARELAEQEERARGAGWVLVALEAEMLRAVATGEDDALARVRADAERLGAGRIARRAGGGG